MSSGLRISCFRSLMVAACLMLPMSAVAQDAIGVGAAFPGPVFTKWTAMAAEKAGVTVTYDPTGAGTAHSRLLAREIDFAISGLPMPREVQESGGLMQFPYLIGGVVCVINVPGIQSNQLNLNGTLLAGIYTGTIKNWNDPAIAAVNPGLALPDLEIRPVAHRDFFGPSYGFTQYIMSVNADWREKYGPFVKKRWSIGSTVENDANMVETIKVLNGSIGYMVHNTAVVTKAVTVKLLNPAGKYVAPTQAGLVAATNNADWAGAENLVVPLYSRPGEASWPISQTSYMQMPRVPRDKAHGEAMRKFIDFIFTHGGDAVTASNFVPLPAAAQARVRAMLNGTGG